MRYQRVSPDYIPLTNGSGRKPILRACKEEEAEDGRIAGCHSLDAAKPQRPRSASASASGSASDHHHSPPISASPPESLHSEAHAAASPAHRPPAGHHEINGVGGDVLLQWGHNKRSRGSRAESRSAATAGDESPAQARQGIRIQRRAVAERLAAAAMPPPPCGSYTRGANLRPCTPVRDSAGPHLRSAEERSGGQSRSEKRAPTSPAHRMAPAVPLPNGCDASECSKQPSDQETGCGGGGAAAAAEKLNLEQFEWPRIYVSLSRKEKEDDFLAMKGTKLPQRPKKRAKNIDKTLQYCFPGMWLSDLTRGRYEVREKKCVKKKRRGLKGMESVDSDSE